MELKELLLQVSTLTDSDLGGLVRFGAEQAESWADSGSLDAARVVMLIAAAAEQEERLRGTHLELFSELELDQLVG